MNYLLGVVGFFLSSHCSCLYIDLTYSLSNSNSYFPTETRFNFTETTALWTNDSYFYSSNTFKTSEHMGTHLDAPYHFSNVSWKTDQIPIERLMSIASLIIDVSIQCKQNKSYEVTIDDIKKYEPINLKKYFVILFYTGWTRYWSNQTAYAGPSYKDNSSNGLEFPGVKDETADYLVNKYNQTLVGVGIDTLSNRCTRIPDDEYWTLLTVVTLASTNSSANNPE
ncbi:unnamed protein product [Didymodactylos carnosus]|uniref:Uncharacterized protein n=1 Tax=Didymodactylos carnosus TaxID=1234261 RepID=A0A814NY90_9BILA|nr:unnamed protein product [Didymodactylos carnosus]CAF3862578.1 unnamed protein product [Didymodactylos carnosus]